jgi:diguanylate cyclase (GGDEF)-like protein
MVDSLAWLVRLEALCSKYEKSLQPPATVNDDINQLLSATDSPVEAVTLELQRKEPLDNVHLGKAGAGSATDIETTELHSFVHRLCIWRNRHVPVDVDSLRKLFLRLAAGHWKTNLHDRFGLLSFQYNETKDLLENTIAAAHAGVYLLFTDLDHFKAVNDKYGQDGGDSAILQFGAVFDAAARPDAIPIHRSGDEYCAVIFSDLPEVALKIAERVSRAVQQKDFKVKATNINLGTTIGLTAVPPGVHTYTDVEDLAVRSIKPPTGKQRGKIRFSKESGTVDQVSVNQRAHLLALCEVKTNIPMAAPFASPVLNLISERIVAIEGARNPTDVQNAVDEAVQSSTVDIVSNILQSSLGRECRTDVSMKISQCDIALAAAHGIFRSSLLTSDRPDHADSLIVLYDPDICAVELRTKPTDQTILRLGTMSVVPKILDLGGFAKASASITALAGRRAVLIKVGHAPLEMPTSLFAELIIVDDRPTRGGGLPDFWEATIARLTGVLQRDPNTRVTFVYGDIAFASLTAAKLNAVTDWTRDAESLAFKTGMATDAIRAAAHRLTGHITFTNSIDEVIGCLADVVREPIELKELVYNRSQNGGAFLERTLFERTLRLDLGDGCRIATITEAYPVVIEIIRKTKQAWNARDQAGIALRELTDFKVHLTDPTRDKVPAFYAREKDSLEQYFVREFLSETGTFGRVLHKTGQVEPVLKHVVSTISESQIPATTRRGILIIPHDQRIPYELAPLGLVSVRIVPRISDRKVRFNYSFVWRTVEVLVGFPYSLFGSVRYSEHLTEQLKQRLSSSAYSVELGEVSYIAQSLHMFTDEYGQIIARRIVNDASL